MLIWILNVYFFIVGKEQNAIDLVMADSTDIVAIKNVNVSIMQLVIPRMVFWLNICAYKS